MTYSCPVWFDKICEKGDQMKIDRLIGILSLLFEHEYSDDEGLISWMLSCRDKVTVIEPEFVREKLYQIACDMTEKYERKG